MSGVRGEELPFERLGEYTVLAPISEGGMASVWLGRETAAPSRFAALKVIRPEHGRDKAFVAMFLDEAKIASRLSHPNIIAIRGLGQEGRRHFLAMEVLRGRTLLEVWERAHARKRKLPYELVAWMGARVADALHHVHEARDESGHLLQVVHRDVSPSNIFLTDEGVPKVIDFGLAKARDRLASTAIGVIKGKLAYLAPEQVLGHAADRRGDVFALGVTLWEVSLDRRLFRSDSDIETLRRVRDAAVPDPRTVVQDYPPALAEAIVRALAKNPAERWQTAGDLRDALDAVVRESGRSIDEHTMQAAAAELFEGSARAAWERLIDDPLHVSHASHAVGASHGSQPVRVREGVGEDVRAAGAESSDPSQDKTTIHRPEQPLKTRRQVLDSALAQRLAASEPDPAAIARAWLERALVDDLLGDGERAAEYAEASLAAWATQPAHAMLRRLQTRPGLEAGARVGGSDERAVGHLDAELAEATSDGARADLLADRARLVDTAGDPKASRDAWERVLQVRPDHPAALRALERALSAPSNDPGVAAALAEHLGRMSDAYAGEPKLAAWLQVERAEVFDRRLGQVDAAKAALLRALSFERSERPVRAACVRHSLVHRDGAWLVALLAEEASLEGDSARAARLELDAACVARRRLGDVAGALGMLERAHARVPIEPDVHRRILDELIVLHELACHSADALRARRLRLACLDAPRARAHELRVIASFHEQLGDPAGAVAALERAVELAPGDASLVHELDRLLEVTGNGGARVDLWAVHAAGALDGAERARRLLRSADLAAQQGQMTKAVEVARAAMVADPAEDAAVDRLLGWLSVPAAGGALGTTRARIAAHAHGAEHAPDGPRRIAHLEAIALLEEEMIGDPRAAAAAHEAILRSDPGRRTALVGLARTAARAGDAVLLVKALLEEAGQTADAATGHKLRVRAAEATVGADPEQALALVRDVLARAPEHADARRLERRLHELAERWALADGSMASAIAHARDPGEAVDLWLARAELQRARLRAPKDAIASLRTALSIDAHHPGAREGLASLLEATGDPALLRDGFVELATTARSAEQRARGFARAAEIDELVLDEGAHAADLYVRARAEAPESAWLEEREVRLLVRLARNGSRGPLLAALIARCDRAPERIDRAFDLAMALLDEGDPSGQASTLLEGVLAVDGAAAHALRSLERVARETESADRMADTLAREAASFRDPAVRLGALWAGAGAVSRRRADGDSANAVARILEHAPADRSALAEAVRLAVPRARAGDAAARARLVEALRVQLTQADSPAVRHSIHLSLALLLEPETAVTPSSDGPGRAALLHYRKVLEIDPGSIAGAHGTARLGSELGDVEAMIAAALSHAELTDDPKGRAALLVQAAEQTLSAKDFPHGTRSERLARAGEMAERALLSDPEAVRAVAVLVAVRNEEGLGREGRDRLIRVLRGAIERAGAGPAVVDIGIELARLAVLDPADSLLAIEALRRVNAASPGHPAALRGLADQFLTMEAWGDGVAALEQIATGAREPRARLAALFDLARVYAEKLKRPADVDRVLHAALDIDPTSVDALRGLLAHRRASGAPPNEIARWLARLGAAEPGPAVKAGILTELAELLQGLGDVAGAEQALVEATAQAPTAAGIARLLALLVGTLADQARALNAVVERAKALDRPDAGCFAVLGRLEIDGLGRFAEGVAHLRLALGLAPGMHEARAALARGLVPLRSCAEAVGLLSSMITPDAGPLLSLGDPTAAFATLESALAGEGRHDEAVVARELRAFGGGLDDGAHAELRARRHPTDSAAPVLPLLDVVTLRASVVPEDVPALLLDLVAAVSGAAGRFARIELEDLGISPRDRFNGHPRLVVRLARSFGLEPPDVVVSALVARPRIVVNDATWLLVPEALLAQSEPVQTACLVGPLLRLALGLPWLEDMRGVHAQTVLCAAARQVVPGFGNESIEAGALPSLEDLTKRMARAVGRKQRKALQDLGPALGATPAPTLAEVEAFEQGVVRAELRAAFLATGDLLATLDCARAADADLARSTAAVGNSALAAALSRPLLRDLASFAFAPATTALRRKMGTTWSRSR